MKKYLIVSGCSFTTNDFRSTFHPHMKCDWPKWPELLAKKLGMEVINLAKSGGGNEFIFSTLIDQLVKMNHNEIGLVIPAWSQSVRRDWQVRKFWHNTIIADKGDLEYHINKSLRYYYMFQLYCESNNIPYKQVQMIEFIRKRMSTNKISILHKETYEDDDGPDLIKDSIYYNKINTDKFLGYPMLTDLDGFDIQRKVTNNRSKEIDDVFRLSEQDAHPSMKGHRMIASFLYENL